MAIPISVTLLTRNSSKHLPAVLQGLTDFDEVLVLDTGSTDDTLDIAQRFSNVRIEKSPFEGFGAAHNKATALAKHDWIFSVDSDEVVTPELVLEIRNLTLRDDAVYACPRHTYYRGTLVQWCGWYPDLQKRIYHRKKTRFTDAKVHESIVTEGLRVVKLSHPIIHHSYENTSDFLAKMQAYSSLFAEQNRGKRSSSLCKAILHAQGAFLKSYLLQWGFLGGGLGFTISMYQANTAFYKYLKLAEVNEKVQ